MNMKTAWMTAALLVGAFTAEAADNASVQAADAWIRWLPGTLPAGGFLTVVNLGDRAVRLTGAASDAYARISLHQSRQQGGVASMQPVDAITIAPHHTVLSTSEAAAVSSPQNTRTGVREPNASGSSLIAPARRTICR